MEKEIIYGVFAMEIELPKVTDRKKELADIADTMTSMSKEMQKKGRFVRAYKNLEDAVAECYDANGWRISKILDVPEGVQNGLVQTIYYPMVIEVNKVY